MEAIKDASHLYEVEYRPQGFTVPKGVMHRTRAPVRSVILMIEGKGVVPTGD
jgi:hypothetical protein